MPEPSERLTSGLLTLIAFVALPHCAVAAQCNAPHPFSGKDIPVKEESGETYDAYGLASWLPYGPPTIYYGKRFAELAPLQQSFVRKKECAHLSVPTVDEVRAGCHALKQMRTEALSADDEQALAAWLAAQDGSGVGYRGTGARYWDAVLQCAKS